MADTLTTPRLTQNAFDELSAPMELDLIAYFNVLNEIILQKLEENKNKDIDEIIDEIESIFK